MFWEKGALEAVEEKNGRGKKTEGLAASRQQSRALMNIIFPWKVSHSVHLRE